jgi:hypothetical protein
MCTLIARSVVLMLPPFHKKLQSTALQGAGKQGKNDVH